MARDGIALEEWSLMQSSAGSRVLSSLAERVLGRLDELTDRLVAELVQNDDIYGDSRLVPREDLRASCRDNLQQVITRLSAPTWAESALAPPRQTGRRRAEQGFPLENLLHAYRVGGRIIWQALTEEAALDGTVRERDLLHDATQVWDVIDVFSQAVGDAYRRREVELHRHDDERRLLLIDGLLEGRAVDAAFAREAAATLDLPEQGPFAVAVVRLPTTNAVAPPPPPAHTLHAVWRLRSGSQTAVIPLRSQPFDVVRGVLSRHVASPTGLSPPVDWLGDLAVARHWAETAAATITDAHEHVAYLDEHLPAALVASAPTVASRLLARSYDPLNDLDPEERERLITTVHGYIDSNLSISEASARLFCHRNTVLNRLRRYEQLTGRELSRTEHLVELALARIARALATDHR